MTKKQASLVYLDAPSAVDPKVLALSMAIAATARDVAKKLGLDSALVTIKLDVGQDSIRFLIQEKAEASS